MVRCFSAQINPKIVNPNIFLFKVFKLIDNVSVLIDSFVYCSGFISVGDNVSVWHHQWEVLWQHQELDTKYRRGKCYTFTILRKFPGNILSSPLNSSYSTLQQTWKGWSLGTNVTSMTSDRCPETEERRWWKALNNHNKDVLYFWLVFLPLLPAGSWLWNQVHGDECKGKHQCGERECCSFFQLNEMWILVTFISLGAPYVFF